MAIHTQDSKELIIPTKKGNLTLTLPTGTTLDEALEHLKEFEGVLVQALKEYKEKVKKEEEQVPPSGFEQEEPSETKDNHESTVTG